MVVKCLKCDVEIPDERAADIIKCVECANILHISCANVKRSVKKSSWKCVGCVAESSSTSSRGDPDQNKVLEAIAAFRSENNAKWEENKQTLNQVQHDVTNVKEDLASLKLQYGEVKAECSKNSKNIDFLSVENKQLKDKVSKLESQMKDIQQHTRKNNLIISGIPLSTGENVYGILEDVASVLNVTYYRSDISAAHRLPVIKGSTNPPSIVVCFVSRSTKEDWLAARRAKKTLMASEIHSSLPRQAVYLNDHLTAETRIIFNRGRALVKEGKLAYVWTRDSRVLVKRSVSDKTTRVRSVEELESLVASRGAPTYAHAAARPTTTAPAAPPATPASPVTSETPVTQSPA